MGHLCAFCVCLLILVSALQGIEAVEYKIVNNAPQIPGGKRFDREIGIPYTIQLMGTINKFIWKIFEENTPADRKNVPILTVYISDFAGGVEGYTNQDNINISAPYLMAPSDLKQEFGLLMYHEMTHIFQWSGNYTAPGGLTEGIADYVMRKSDLFDPRTSSKPGIGKKWDEGYEVTSLFLEYLDTLKPGFTVALNKKMRYAWSEDYFIELLGKPLDQLWSEYKAKYGNIPATDNSLWTRSLIHDNERL